MPYGILLYAFFVSLGCLGVGYSVWSLCQRNIREAHPCLTWGISWFVGYFIFEGVLSTMSFLGQFHPVKVMMAGILLSGFGIYQLVSARSFFQPSKLQNIFGPCVLFGLAGFVFFWNLYPTYDVDSLSSYFAALRHMLDSGGKQFSRFDDIRFSMPLGENMLYALGFAWQSHSTVFPQLIQGFSKVMMLFCVYGAARSLGAGVFSLIAPAMVLSEEHFIASGTNMAVHINVNLVAAVFLLFFSLLMFFMEKRGEYFILAVWASLSALSCKYLGVIYCLGTLGVLGFGLIVHKEMRSILKDAFRKHPVWIWLLLAAAFFASVNYTHNVILTGSPVFPASLGPLKSGYFDPSVAEIGRRWHTYLSLPEALKNVTAFMVWPGILPSKSLFPLAMAAALAAMLFLKKSDKMFTCGMYFFCMSLLVVIIQETYIVFEMRYYRFGLGVYALTWSLLLTSIWMCFSDRFKIPAMAGEWFKRLVVILICLYCVRYSFNSMGPSRPSYRDIADFMDHKKTESQIIAQRYSQTASSFAAFEELHLNPRQLAFFTSVNWPYFYYPIPGKNIAFLQSAAFPSPVYFNEGLFANELNAQGIRYVFNKGIVMNGDYPLAGGAVYEVLSQCGHPMAADNDVLELSGDCLEKLAVQKDGEDAKRRLEKALVQVRAQQYIPFNPPPYGGIRGVIR